MIAKKYKLPIQGFLAKKPRVVLRTDFFMVRQLPNTLSYSRLGVVISKKVSPSAVIRNEVKRTVFNFIKENKIHFKHGRDVLLTVIFQVKKGEGVDRKKLEVELRKTLGARL